MPYLGAFAQATLKAAVINAENRNRLTEEDKCWRDKSKENKRKRKAEETNSLLEQKNDRIKVTRLKAKKHVDKWDNDGYYTNHPEDIGPALPPVNTEKADRFSFFASRPKSKSDDVIITSVMSPSSSSPAKTTKIEKSKKKKSKKKTKKKERRRRHSSD